MDPEALVQCIRSQQCCQNGQGAKMAGVAGMAGRARIAEMAREAEVAGVPRRLYVHSAPCQDWKLTEGAGAKMS